MKIGIIGLGVVGNACKNGFKKNGYDICVHDIKLETTINDVLNTDDVFNFLMGEYHFLSKEFDCKFN